MLPRVRACYVELVRCPGQRLREKRDATEAGELQTG